MASKRMTPAQAEKFWLDLEVEAQVWRHLLAESFYDSVEVTDIEATSYECSGWDYPVTRSALRRLKKKGWASQEKPGLWRVEFGPEAMDGR